MLYLIFGQNSFEAIKKIKEIKAKFLKKNPHFLLEELDGDNFKEFINPSEFMENKNLFSDVCLFVFKNILSKILEPEKFLKKYSDFLKNSKDVFLFWERELKKDDEIFELFKENATKIQEIKSVNLTKKELYVASPFGFVDKIFSSFHSESLLSIKRAGVAGIDTRSLINVIFWKIKKMPHKDKHALDIAYKAIITDLNLKIDSKNEEDHLARLALSIPTSNL